jgi:hypothetical protein
VIARLRRFLYENSLSIGFGVLFLGAIVGQAIFGLHKANEDQDRHHGAHFSFGRYVSSSQFAAAVMENWQSEYLQFTLFVLLTVWLIQRGSPESKPPGEEGGKSDEEERIGRHADEGSPLWARVGGIRTKIYSNSLLLLMTFLWLGTWFAQAVAGRVDYNAERLSHQQNPVSWVDYLGRADFWERTLENWQSEFLAVGSMAIFAVYLRQRGSAQSKPVGAPHEATESDT